MWHRRLFTRLTVPLSTPGYFIVTKSDCERQRAKLVQAKSTSHGKVASSERKDPKFRRFYNFATIQINGQYFMTPSDFLESVTEATPRKSAYRWLKIMPYNYKCVFFDNFRLSFSVGEMKEKLMTSTPPRHSLNHHDTQVLFYKLWVVLNPVL